MAAQIIDGKATAAAINAETKDAVAQNLSRLGRAPKLGVILCGDDPASGSYVRGKERTAAALGIEIDLRRPDANSSTTQLIDLVTEFNGDPGIDGILVQSPLPSQVDEEAVLWAVAREKDADGFHPYNQGLLAAGITPPAPTCTPAGCMELLARHGIAVAGARAVVIGRSTIVGRPVALMLLNQHATVTICHSKTRDLAAVCREADILIAAVGRPLMVKGDWVKPGAAVIDVGINRVADKLVGDVDFAAVREVAGWITPVPGGVGPMTIAMLMRNVVHLWQANAHN